MFSVAFSLWASQAFTGIFVYYFETLIMSKGILIAVLQWQTAQNTYTLYTDIHYIDIDYVKWTLNNLLLNI